MSRTICGSLDVKADGHLHQLSLKVNDIGAANTVSCTEPKILKRGYVAICSLELCNDGLVGLGRARERTKKCCCCMLLDEAAEGANHIEAARIWQCRNLPRVYGVQVNATVLYLPDCPGMALSAVPKAITRKMCNSSWSLTHSSHCSNAKGNAGACPELSPPSAAR